MVSEETARYRTKHTFGLEKIRKGGGIIFNKAICLLFSFVICFRNFCTYHEQHSNCISKGRNLICLTLNIIGEGGGGGRESIRETFSHLHPFPNEKLGEFAHALSIKYSVERWSTSFVTVNHTKETEFSANCINYIKSRNVIFMNPFIIM